MFSNKYVLGTTNPLLMCDYYKMVHAKMLPVRTQKSVSYFTPRSSRIPGWDHAVFFGLRGFLNQTDAVFKEGFFEREWKDIELEMRYYIGDTLSKEDAETFIQRAEDLHELGYLPLEFSALPEGSHVNMKVPMFSITNTHPLFAWLPQFIEPWLSCEMWHGIVCATVADKFRTVVDRYYDKTVDDCVDHATALSAFDMRGEESISGAVKAGAAWCTSFKPCSTASVGAYLMYNYDAKDVSRMGTPSTEHAVMCSNFAVDGDEITFLKRLLTEIYPSGPVSVVMDSYDYWGMVDKLATIKDIILNRDGCLLVRGDSGNPAQVVTETVFRLWDMFGGTYNSKGYKVLDKHIKAIYGDQITLERCEEIYKILEENGFAANNVALGVGSFSMQAVKVNGEYYPFTRDTFNIAIKATYIKVDDKGYKIFKNPKVQGAHGESVEYYKKSAKGLVEVRGDDGNYRIIDDLDCICDTELDLVYEDGKFYNCDTLEDIRDRLNEYRAKQGAKE